MCVHHARDQSGNSGEAELAGAEAFHCHLVGCIEYCRQCAAGFTGASGQAQGWESIRIRFLEGELADLGEVRLDAVAAEALRVKQRVLDGQAHVRRGQLGDDGTVDVFHHGMHHALRVYDHLNSRHFDVEEPARLDHFEPLVEEGGRIDGDFAAHDPGGMLEGLLDGDGLQSRLGPLGRIAEGSARGGEPQVAHRRGGLAVQALEDGRMLAVHRQDLNPVGLGLAHDRLAGHHQDFLGGHGDVLAGPDGGQGGFQTGRAHDGNENNVRLRQRSQSDQGFRPREHFGGVAQRRPDSLRLAGVMDRGQSRPMPAALFDEQVGIATGGQPHQLEAVGLVFHHFQGAGANRTGAAKQDDALHVSAQSGGGSTPAARACAST